jgi:hypothetical protein
MRNQPATDLLESVAAELAQLYRAKHYSLWCRDTVPRLTAALAQEPPFSNFRSVWIHTGDGGGFATTSSFGKWAIDLLVEKKTPEAIIEAFLNEVGRNVGRYSDVSPVFGVEIDARCELGEGIVLTPTPQDLFASLLQRALLDYPLPAGISFLQQSFTVQPAFSPSSDESSSSFTTPEMNQRDAIRRRVRLSCLLASTHAVELPLTALRPEIGALFVSDESRSMERLFAARPVVCFPVKATGVKRAFELLGEFSEFDSLGRAIDRLGRARLAASPVDRALELGIAAEIALMHDKGSDNSEITHKIGSRAAWLLGRDPTEREAIFGEMKALYRARSQAVHRGKLSSESIVDLAAADLLVARALTSILERGCFPNWNSLTMGDSG